MHALAALNERHWLGWLGRTAQEPASESFVVAVYAVRQLSINALDRAEPDLTTLADAWTSWLAACCPTRRPAPGR